MSQSILSNYPAGFANGVTVRGMPLMQTHPGKVFWLYNGTTGLLAGQRGGSDGNRGTFDSPFGTLGGALAQCVANRGDIIMVKPGHAETFTNATAASVLWSVAGVAIVGLGAGANRPTFTFTTANTAKITVSANNVSVQNCLFIGNFLSIATCFLLTTAADFTVDRCSFRDTDATHGFLSIVTTTVAVNSDGLTFTNNEVQSDATTTPGPAVVIANTIDRVNISDNFVTHSVASNNISALIEHGALVVTHLLCLRNYVYSINTDTATGAILVKTSAITGSGIIAHNRIRALDVAAAIVITANAVQYGAFDNLYIGDGTQNSGFVLPSIGSDS
jgi:hypothetical protein